MSGSQGGSLSSGISRNLLGNVIGPLAGLASAPILAHALGVDGRGEVAAATAPFLLITTVAALGIPEAVTYHVAKDATRYGLVQRRAAWILLVAGIVATGVAFLASSALSGGDTDLATLIIVASLAIVPTILIGLLRGGASGLGLWTLVALERGFGPLLRLAVIVALALTETLNVVTAVIAIAYCPVAAGLAYLWTHRSSRELRASEARNESLDVSYKAIFSYGSRVWLGAIAGVILMRIDQVLMVPLSSSHQLGLYVVAVTISELPLVVNTAVREVIFASHSKSTSDQMLTQAARLSFLVCGLAAVVLGVSAAWWLPVLFGEGFSAALPAVVVLLMAVAVGIPGSVAGAGLSARGLPQLRSYSLLVACTVNVVLVFALVPTLGAVGAAIGTLIGNLISSNINVIQMRTRFGVSFWDFYLVRADDLRVLWKSLWRVLGRQGGLPHD